jgi:hypothetical protein
LPGGLATATPSTLQNTSASRSVDAQVSTPPRVEQHPRNPECSPEQGRLCRVWLVKVIVLPGSPVFSSIRAAACLRAAAAVSSNRASSWPRPPAGGCSSRAPHRDPRAFCTLRPSQGRARFPPSSASRPPSGKAPGVRARPRRRSITRTESPEVPLLVATIV